MFRGRPLFLLPCGFHVRARLVILDACVLGVSPIHPHCLLRISSPAVSWCVLISSHLISSHLVSSHLISSHLISSHLISSHLISSHLISSHLISSHLISSHLISSHLMLLIVSGQRICRILLRLVLMKVCTLLMVMSVRPPCLCSIQ